MPFVLTIKYHPPTESCAVARQQKSKKILFNNPGGDGKEDVVLSSHNPHFTKKIDEVNGKDEMWEGRAGAALYPVVRRGVRAGWVQLADRRSLAALPEKREEYGDMTSLCGRFSHNEDRVPAFRLLTLTLVVKRRIIGDIILA